MTTEELKRATELRKAIGGVVRFTPKPKEVPKAKALPMPPREAKKILPSLVKVLGTKLPPPKDGEDGSPDTPEQIAEKLNTLRGAVNSYVIDDISDEEMALKVIEAIRNLKGNDRIDISNIRNGEHLASMAQKNFDMSDQRWHGAGTGGGQLVKVLDLSSLLDGLTKVFDITGSDTTSTIIAVQYSSFPFIFRPTVDYTFAYPNLTFDASVDAPVAGQTLTVIFTTTP